jgi:diguanylate cyclase (GGDEF)-like protein/PAS domain S-box-containing protein
MEQKDVLSTNLEQEDEAQKSFLVLRTGVGILIHDATNRRLVEGASIQLDLIPLILDETSLTLESLAGLELIVADGIAALRIRSILSSRQEWPRRVNPALITVVLQDTANPLGSLMQTVDGVLVLPQEPASVAAKLSLILYTHRGLAERYQTAVEEVYLNKKIFQSVTTGITVANALLPDMPLIYVNPAFEVMTGYKFEEIQGSNCRFLQGDDHEQSGVILLREALKAQRSLVTLLKNYKKDGTHFWNELSLSPIFNRDGLLTHFVGIQTDVTARVEAEMALVESRRQLTELNQQLMRLSVTDSLTGLKNRRAFDERLTVEISSVRRTKEPSTLVLMDIDYFKQINDEHGHLAGDEVLCEVARLLESSLRAVDIAARYGGEEFGIFLSGSDTYRALTWVRRFYSLLSESQWRYRAVTVSMGLAEMTPDIETQSEIVHRADEALYRAKREGRARAIVYSPGDGV